MSRRPRYILLAQEALLTANIRSHLQATAAEGLSVNTRKSRAKVLRMVQFEVGDPDGLTREDITNWLATEGWAPKTRQTYHLHIAAYYRWAQDVGAVSVSPMAGMHMPKVAGGLPRPATNEQLGDVLERATNPLRLCVVLAAYAGLRCCEIATLEREDVTSTQIRIRKGKGGKPAVVPAHPLVWKAVEGLPDGVLIEHVGGRSSAQWVSCFGSRELNRLGLRGLTLHRFRHSFGTNVYRQNRDLLVTQQLLRHTSVATTQVYALVEDAVRTAAVLALPTPGGYR